MTLFLSGFSLQREWGHGALGRGLPGIEVRTPQPIVLPAPREARAMRRLGSGRPGRQMFSGSFSLTGWGGGGGRPLVERSVITLLDHWQIFSELFSPLPRPSPTTKSNTSPVSLPSALNLHQKKLPVSFLLVLLVFYTLLCVVELSFFN